jgi:hypothetical protein
MVRNIIAKTETFDRMRHESCKVVCYEEKDYDDNSYFYTVIIDRSWNEDAEEYESFDTFEFDTMAEALAYVELISGHVSPTNDGVPAFPED